MTQKKDVEIVGGRTIHLGHFWVKYPSESIDSMTRKDFEKMKDDITEKIADYQNSLKAQMKADLTNLFRGFDLEFDTE